MAAAGINGWQYSAVGGARLNSAGQLIGLAHASAQWLLRWRNGPYSSRSCCLWRLISESAWLRPRGWRHPARPDISVRIAA